MKVSVEYPCLFCRKRVSKQVEMNEAQLQDCRERAEKIKKAIHDEDKSGVSKLPDFSNFSFDKCPFCGKRNDWCGEPVWETLLIGFSGMTVFVAEMIFLINLFQKHFLVAGAAFLGGALLFAVVMIVGKSFNKHRKHFEDRIKAGEIQEENIPAFIHYID